MLVEYAPYSLSYRTYFVGRFFLVLECLCEKVLATLCDFINRCHVV